MTDTLDSAPMAHTHPPALFVAGSVGLDFLNTVATPTADTPVDWLNDGDGLLAWLKDAQLVPAEVLDALRIRAMPEEMDRVAAQARSLREWFRTFVRERQGRPLSAADLRALEPLNTLLQRDEEFSEIAPDDRHGAAFTLRRTRRWRSPEALLLPIGQALARFVCDEDFSDVKACEGSSCTLTFVDRTRGRKRRWCSMAICGNRTKAALHRKRLKATSSS